MAALNKIADKNTPLGHDGHGTLEMADAITPTSTEATVRDPMVPGAIIVEGAPLEPGTGVAF